MKTRFCLLLGAGLLLVAATAEACTPDGDDAACGAARRPPRIIFGESRGATFDFGEFRPLRRSAASSRQAYFGSGALYSETLAGLQAQMQSLQRRYELEALPLTAAQQAARGDMAPALMRALTLAKRSREGAAETD